MAGPSRTAQFSRLHKILKRHYSPVAPAPHRSLLEHLLFASCLENAHHRVAEEAFAALVHTFFDWNEIRVSSVRELSEVVAGLPDPPAAAHRVKRILQSVFEATYSFDLEELHKQNLGPAVERLEKIEGATKFSIAYVVQSALGGHSIPIDSGTLGALRLVDLASDEDVAAGVVPGLERAIPKNSGIEFGSLLHQLGADFTASPYSPALHAFLLEIEPKAKDRLPSRRAKRALQATPGDSDESKGKKAAPEAAPALHKPRKSTGETKRETLEAKKDSGEETPAGVEEPAKDLPLETKKKPVPPKKKAAAEAPLPEPEPPAPAEAPRKKENDSIEAEASQAGKKKPVAPPKKAPSKKKPEEGKGKSQADQATETSGPDAIAKRKPR